MRLFDPASGLHIELGASGEFNIRVTDSRRLLLKVVGTTGALGQNDLLGGGTTRGIFRALVMTQVKSYLARVIRESGINVLEIDERLMELSTALRDRINEGLKEYGVTMPEFFVSRIVTPDDDPNFRRMKEQYAEQYLLVRQEQIKKSEAEAAQARKAVEAETAARLKDHRGPGRSGGPKDPEGSGGGGLPDAGGGRGSGDADEGLHLPAGDGKAGRLGSYEERADRRGGFRGRHDGRYRRPWDDSWSHGRRDRDDQGGHVPGLWGGKPDGPGTGGNDRRDDGGMPEAQEKREQLPGQ